MNYLTRKSSQVQNVLKNAMAIDKNENQSWSLHNSTKKVLWFFLPWRDGLSWSESDHSPSRFPSLNIIKNAEARPAPMFDVIIE